jgi:hypothetical protein
MDRMLGRKTTAQDMVTGQFGRSVEAGRAVG